MSGGLRPGEVAAAVGVGRETLRYYERRGLIAPEARTVGGHRVYAASTVERLRAVKAAQRLGFTLEEIDRLTGRRGRGGLQEGTRAKLAQVRERIAELESVAALLEAAASAGCEDLEACAGTPAGTDRFARMDAARSIALFLLAAVAEIGGAWLVWQGLREHRGILWIAAGVVALGAYGFVAAFQPDPNFGRVLAAYGGVFVAGSLAWGMVVDGFRPDRWDVVGAAVCLVGVALIMYAPRG